MDGQPSRSDHRDGAVPPSQALPNPNQPNLLFPPNEQLFPIPNFPIQNPNFPIQNPNEQIQNPNPSKKRKKRRVKAAKGSFERIENAVKKARSDLLATGENVSAWKVAQSALSILECESWELLRYKMEHIPSLHKLMLIEGRINAFIHCFVGTRRISTLYDLEVAVCKNEGVQRFEELELGPLVRHPLVIHYFCVSSDSTEVFKISSEEIISCLREFMDTRKKKDIKADELLDFIAKKRSVTGKEKLNVCVHSLGMHIDHIGQAGQLESITIKKCLEGSGKKGRKRPPSTPQEKQLDENFSAISQHLKSFSSEHGDFSGKQIRFISSSSGVDESDDNKDENCSGSPSNYSSQIVNSSDGVSGCPCPSATEGILSGKEEIPSLASGSLNCNENVGRRKKKRKHSKISCTSTPPRKLHKRDGVEQDRVIDRTSYGHTNCVSIEVEPSEKDAQFVTKHCDVTVEAILKKVSAFFEDYHDIPGGLSSPLEKNMSCFRKVYKCEMWLTEQFSVDKFESLGYGEFLKFLARHVSLLPPQFQKCLVSDHICENQSLEACMAHHLLDVFLAQASSSLLENENLSTQKVSELLTRQFPLIGFKLVEGGSMKDLQDIAMVNRSDVISKRILFSAALSVPQNVTGFSETNVSKKDAVEVLLRAPMLADLDSWSHWDLIFAPSLGPLMGWLLNDLNNEELLCLVTRSGKIIRIDHSATVDSFLEAFLQGSSFQTAVELLSLFALYGGERNVPLSLLKCHAEKAFRVLVKNSMDKEENDCQKYILSELNKDRSQVNKAVSIASKFVLECLAYLPVEFRRFAADLLLSGLQSIVKDAPAAIISQCRQEEHHLMLHELGLSLGIMEWINDYHTFSLSETTKSSDLDKEKDTSAIFTSAKGTVMISVKVDQSNEECQEVDAMANRMEVSSDRFEHFFIQNLSQIDSENGSADLIETIRRGEFGLDPNHLVKESSILKKQHARLGRALHCLSQELYSQDSHFLLELVQNADDNVYPCDVEPTLTFILQQGGIIVLNNEQGFSAENIRALCDVGNSTKKAPSAGYIGKKGIGFKSVFRVTDAPEIHSNGFHIKFDISEGQIGFVLPTVVPPCDIDLFSELVSMDTDPMDKNCWNTCVVLPFRSKLTEPFATDNIISMFSDLHPSLLLFLHRLECIKFRNLLNNSLVVMRKEVVGDGIVNVSLGTEKMTWFIESCKLQANVIRNDVQTTEISIAFTLEESGQGNYIPKLDQQPVFAFLPLRAYGLKFILQADFILPSSREEVDGDSPWNQWLLSEFPNLFVSAERSFCGLPCFRENPGKGVSAFMRFVPLGGEVHGFFSTLPRMIISKLRTSNCLLLEGESSEWVPPCKVLRNWTEQSRSLLPDSLIREHLGLEYLNKDIVLTDSLARALGIEDYGPKILLQIMYSLCRTEGSLQSMGHGWLSSWLNALYLLSFNSSGHSSLDFGNQPDVINTLRKIRFIPLFDGRYGSVDEGTIWLHTDALSNGFGTEHGLEAFGKLYAKLRIVSPGLFNCSVVENLTQMLYKVGVQQLSAHEVLKVHILPAISDDTNATGNNDLMTEYLSFIMFHLQSTCPNCSIDREHIISEVRSKAFISTNYGYKRLVEVPIHFSKDFGNTIDINKLISGIDMKWFEVDNNYLKHPIISSSSGGMLKWRKFLQELGVTDFVQIVQVEKSFADISHVVLKDMMSDMKVISSGSTVKDWESQELVHLLSQVSSSGDREKCKYLLEVLDTLWDDYFSDKLTAFCNIDGQNKPFKSSVISILHDIRWLASSMDDELHYPEDLFHDCDAVHSILGETAAYAVPKVHSVKLLNDIGFKITVTIDDTLSVLQVWRRSETPFRASISQMSKFYTFIWNQMSTSKQKIVDNLCSGAFIFVPYTRGSIHEVVPGLLLSPQEVYWHDSTCSLEQMKSIHPQNDRKMTHRPFSMLCNVYPGLYNFFVNECGVTENPPLLSYLQILLQLSTGVSPSQAAKTVFQVFLKWTDGLKSGLLTFEDIEYLKKSLEKKELMVLPTVRDKWVSLHPSFGLVCWCDDEKLRKEFKKLKKVGFLYLGELNGKEKQMLQEKVSVLIRRLGIPALSEVVSREAIYNGPVDSSFKTSFVSWALPYAQRYIYNVHPNEYSQHKLSGFEGINRLRIVVVEKLFYRNVIKKFDIASRKQFECNCLLQENILYTTRESDSHSIFMELSSFLIAGIPELHLANLLHMITTMAESGYTEEQMECFILNSQKIPKLPDGESVWSLESVPSLGENEGIPTTSSALTMIDEPNPSKSTRKSGIISNWPPMNWKNAPGFSFDALKTRALSSLQMKERCVTEEIATTQADIVALTESNADWTIEETPASTIPAVILQDSEAFKDQSDFGTNIGPSDMNVRFDSLDLVTTLVEKKKKNKVTKKKNKVTKENKRVTPSVDFVTPFDVQEPSSINSTKGVLRSSGTFSQRQAKETGRLGELLAFNYFSTKVGEKFVKWVNEAKETGLPFDIVVKGTDGSKEYIEVKSTRCTSKDWFEITVNEWQFAVQKGESFSIARVVLSGKKLAQLIMYKNPVKLCQLRHLQLQLTVAPKQRDDISIIS